MEASNPSPPSKSFSSRPTESVQSFYIGDAPELPRLRAMAFDSLAIPRGLLQSPSNTTEGWYFPLLASPASSTFADDEDNDGLATPFLEYPDQNSSAAGEVAEFIPLSIPAPSVISLQTASPGSVGSQSLYTVSVKENLPPTSPNTSLDTEESKIKQLWKYRKSFREKKKEKDELLAQNEVLRLQRAQREGREERIRREQLPLVGWILRGWNAEIERQDFSNNTNPNISKTEQWVDETPYPENFLNSVYETELNKLIERRYWDIKNVRVRLLPPSISASRYGGLHKNNEQHQDTLEQKPKDVVAPVVDRPAWKSFMMEIPNQVDYAGHESRKAERYEREATLYAMRCTHRIDNWRDLTTEDAQTLDPNNPISVNNETEDSNISTNMQLDSLQVGDSYAVLVGEISDGGTTIPAALAPLQPYIITNGQLPPTTTKWDGGVRSFFGSLRRRD